nr:DUF2844 domain-containing protein [uncultured Duganella sp.]
MRQAIALMLLLTLLQGALAWAALGGTPSDFTGGPPPARRAPPAPAPADAVHTVTQSRLAGGTVLRAYRDAAGNVFAVSWRGPAPDLRPLLGHTFALAGARAWLPAALPPGFDAATID